MKKLLFSLMPLTLFALPTGMDVQQGKVNSCFKGKAMTLNTGKGAIIHWQDFSIQPGEKVRIRQATNTSKVLNRVTGGVKSSIYGRLESNGKVYLINPAGILIAPQGLVRCAGFTASTADISNDEFMRGRDIRHTDIEGDISVLGRIEGPTALYAKCIKHQGVIDANQVVEKEGHVLLAAENCCEALQSPIHAKKVELVSLVDIVLTAADGVSISAMLDAGTDVVQSTPDRIRTAEPVTISWSLAPSKLTLEAGLQINFSTHEVQIESSFAGVGNFDALEMTAGVIAPPTLQSVSAIRLQNSGFIRTTNGNVYIEGRNFSSNSNNGITTENNISIESVGTGTITLMGVNTTGNAANQGNGMNINTSMISVVDADLNLDGRTFAPPNTTFSAGIRTLDGSVESTGSGDIFYRGESTPLTTTGNGLDGVIWLGQPTTTTSFSSGSQVYTGLGGQGTDSCTGIQIVPPTVLSVSTGDIVMNGSAVRGTTAEAIDINNGAVVHAESGLVNMTGVSNANSSGFNGYGVNLGRILATPNPTVSTNTGQIILHGTSDFSASSTAGVHFGNDAVISARTGTIDITGISRSTGSNGQGIRMDGLARVESLENGSITLNGEGSSAGTTLQSGVSITNTAIVSNQAGQTIIIGNTPSGSSSPGVNIFSDFSFAAVETVTGNIEITGSSTSSGGINPGIEVRDGVIMVGDGVLIMNGLGSDSSVSSSPGISITGALTSIELLSGTATLTGTGRGTGTDNSGIAILAASEVFGDSGSVNLVGYGSSVGSDQCSGIFMDGISLANVASGTLNITGTAQVDATNTHGIYLIGGALASSTSGQVNMTGFGYSDAIYNASHGVFIESIGTAASSTGGSIRIRGTSGAPNSSSYGVVEAGSGTTISNTSGSITITGLAPITNKGILMDTAEIVNGSGSTLLQTFSDIDLTNGAQIISSGPVTLNSVRDINITGSDTSVLNTTISSSSQVLLIADANINIAEGITSVAQIESTGSNLTFVVDDEYPVFPNLGPGQFNLGPNNLISASAQLRLYTVQPSQNSINSPLNGQTFSPGSFGINTATEQWLTWYPDGPFGGGNFTIYYKVGFNPGVVGLSQVLVSQLFDLLPVIRLQPFSSSRGNSVSNYHGKFGEPEDLFLDPRFEPYSSFIFEDRVFWTWR